MTAHALPLDMDWPSFWQQINRALASRRYSHSTRRQYRQVLRGLKHAGMSTPRMVTPERVSEFLSSLAMKGCSWSWIAQNISVIRTVFDCIGGSSITAGMLTPKRPYRLPEILSETEVIELLHACTTIRDQLLLGLMYGCGLAPSEVTALRWQNINTDAMSIQIPGSRRYETRQLPLPDPFRGYSPPECKAVARMHTSSRDVMPAAP